MSDSSAGEREASVPAASDALARDAAVRSEIAAEIADHLASAAGEIERGGVDSDAAERLALERFGDVAKVQRQCWWIRMGDQVMLRTTWIALLAMTAVGLVVLALGGWQLQRTFSAQTMQMNSQLESLTETQQTMLEWQRAPKITGRAYFGGRSRPAKNFLIRVDQFGEGGSTTVRQLRTDEQGRFDSGALPAGDYCLLAEMRDEHGKYRYSFPMKTQSLLLPLFSGADRPSVDLDLLPGCQVLVAPDTTVPRELDVGGKKVEVAFKCELIGLDLARLPTRFTGTISDRGQIYGGSNSRWNTMGPDAEPRSAEIVPGKYVLVARLAFVYPFSPREQRPPVNREIYSQSDRFMGLANGAQVPFAKGVQVPDDGIVPDISPISRTLEFSRGDKKHLRLRLLDAETLKTRIQAAIQAAIGDRTKSAEALDDQIIHMTVLSDISEASEIEILDALPDDEN